MATPYNVDSQSKGINSWGTQFCDTVYSAALLANMATSLTVPGTAGTGLTSASVGQGYSAPSNNKFYAVFRYTPGAEVWVSSNSIAAIPVSNSFVTANAIQNPEGKYVRAGQVLNFITANACNVSVEFFSVSP